MAEEPQERISSATREVAERDAQAAHDAPQVPTAAEAEAAERHGPVDPEVAEAYEDYVEQAADHPGEGRLP